MLDGVAMCEPSVPGDVEPVSTLKGRVKARVQHWTGLKQAAGEGSRRG